MAIVFVRYMMIALEQRKDEDCCSLEREIFSCFMDELADVIFAASLQIILKAMFECICSMFKVTEDQMNAFTEMFINRLSEYMRRTLLRVFTDSIAHKKLSDYLLLLNFQATNSI